MRFRGLARNSKDDRNYDRLMKSQQVSRISLTQGMVNKLRLEFEYFQNFPTLVWKSKFCHTESSLIVESIFFAIPRQGSVITFLAQVSKTKLQCLCVTSHYKKVSASIGSNT